MRVVVTRPDVSGQRTARQLIDMGHTPVLMPLTQPAHDGMAAKAALSQPHGALAITSAEVLRALEPYAGEIGPALQTTLFSVGEATSVTAQHLGFETILTAGGNGADLAELIATHRHLVEVPQGTLLYLAGSPRAPVFEDALRQYGVHFQTVECYKMLPLMWSEAQLRRLFLPGRPDAVLFYSAEAARLFFETVAPLENSGFLAQTRFVCISENVADKVPENYRARSAVSEIPLERAMLALLNVELGT
jgi:uroporphyrinogen-III synthase